MTGVEMGAPNRGHSSSSTSNIGSELKKSNVASPLVTAGQRQESWAANPKMQVAGTLVRHVHRALLQSWINQREICFRIKPLLHRD